MAANLSIPLVQKELRQGLRGAAAMVLDNLYLLAIAGTALIAVIGSQASGATPAWKSGSMAFWLLGCVQAVLLAVLGAAVTAPTVTQENEQKTYDILVTTPLSVTQLIWSKLASGFMITATVLTLSLPIAGGLFVLGGVPIGPAFWSYVVLYAGVALAVAIGVFCSATVGRTAFAVPLSVLGTLAVVFVFLSLNDSAPALASFSPLGSVLLLQKRPEIPFFGFVIPAWSASLVLWVPAVLTLAEAAVQRLRAPRLRRLWGVRWRFASLAFLLAMAAMGSLSRINPTGQWCVGST
jgi:ABC-type transport system involved in multi-copper enzyme maturation permease subunit